MTSWCRNLIIKVSRHRFLILSLLLTTAAYSNSLDNGFVSDDAGQMASTRIFSENPLLNLSHPQFTLQQSTPPFSIFALGYRLFGPNPFVFHLINLFFYLIVVLTTYHYLGKILSSLDRDLVTLIFSLHPVHTEAVSFISSGGYLSYTLLFLLAISLYSKWLQQKKRFHFLIATLFASLSLFASPLAASLPFVIVLVELFFGNLKKNWKGVAIFFFLAILVTVPLFAKGVFQYRNVAENLYGRKMEDNSQEYSKIKFLPQSLAKYLNIFFLVESPAFSHQFETNLPAAAAATA